MQDFKVKIDAYLLKGIFWLTILLIHMYMDFTNELARLWQ